MASLPAVESLHDSEAEAMGTVLSEIRRLSKPRPTRESRPTRSEPPRERKALRLGSAPFAEEPMARSKSKQKRKRHQHGCAGAAAPIGASRPKSES